MRSFNQYLYFFIASTLLNLFIIPYTSATSNAISTAPFDVPQYWTNTNFLRVIDLTTHVSRETTTIAAKNVHSEPLGEYYFPIKESLDEHLSYIEASEKRANKVFEVTKAEFDSLKIQFYKITFDRLINPNEKIVLVVKTAFTHILTPYPLEIAQTGRQNLLYRGSIYGNSAYFTEQQKTNIKLPTANVISYTEKPGPVSLNGNTITYGPFLDVKPSASGELSVHYEFQQALLTVKGLRRDLEISHWGGNLAVEEHYNLTHDGARDEIGNVSTSRLRSEWDKTVMEFRPRYPLFGGWNYTWNYGYNVLLGDFLGYNRQNGRYILNIPFINPLHNAVYDKVQIRIILPEGASNVKVETPFPVNKETHTVFKTYFDSKGRYLVVLDKYNVVAEHAVPLQVSYEYGSLELLRKPLVASTFFFCGFLLSIIYSRMEFSIKKKSV
ncbi:9344_t:CDS:2 [Acaulospora colombiana]|uniref:9344_t:CDS:1 n=1 Tax=Acaulospora colombiana TaxID=27376 RepID=A0ACA9LE72_9GLOM|nr:9344_t:CDS:2 [Acaulospora colombiana]